MDKQVGFTVKLKYVIRHQRQGVRLVAFDGCGALTSMQNLHMNCTWCQCWGVTRLSQVTLQPHVCVCVPQTLTCCCFLLQAARPRRRSSPAPAQTCRAPPAAPCWLLHPERRAQSARVTGVTTADRCWQLYCNHRGPANSTGPTLRRHTLRMRMKSCLSTRRKWQLSSLRMMVAARGASFSKASCPKSSPSCKVVTSPCSYAHFHVRLAPNSNVKSDFKNDLF